MVISCLRVSLPWVIVVGVPALITITYIESILVTQEDFLSLEVGIAHHLKWMIISNCQTTKNLLRRIMISKASEKQDKIYHDVSDRVSDLVMACLNEQGYDQEENREAIDPVLTAAIAVATEFSYHAGYDRGEILDKVCDAIDNAREYEDKLMCDDCGESLIEKSTSDEEERPEFLN